MAIFFGAALLTLLGVIGWYDIRERRVPNLLVVAIVALYALAVATSAVAVTPLVDLAAAAAFLAVALLLWLPGWLGGGDAKLLAALGLWAGPARAFDLALAVATAGGLLAMAVVVGDRLARWRAVAPVRAPGAGMNDRAGIGRDAGAAAAAPPSLPYAVAIGLGALIALHDVFLT